MEPITRRGFLATTLAAPSISTNWETPESPVVDTHLHCFAGAEDSRFPYHSRAPYRPEAPATPQHLLRCMKTGGVHYAVVVHPEPYQDDHRYLQYCLSLSPEKLRGTCLFFADRPGSVEKMPAIIQGNRQIIAARLHAFVANRLPPFGTAELTNYWKVTTDLGLAMQLHFAPTYAPALESYIRDFPDTPVIIDHLGRPMQGTQREHDRVIRWSRFPNTILKISSLASQNVDPQRPLLPIVKKITKAYGADRIIYGGGFHRDATGKSYQQYRERVGELLAHLPDIDQKKILGGNAFRLFRFGV